MNWAQRTNNPTNNPSTPLASPSSAYANAALQNELTILAGAVEGTRNTTLNNCALKLATLIGQGLTEHQIRTELGTIARQIGLTNTETEATLTSAIRAGLANPRTITPRPDPSAHVVETTLAALGVTTDELTDFWDARPILRHLHTFAHARMSAPWAVLAITLARVLATVPPHVVLPAIVGGHGSLNVFLALVGPSGAGKGSAEAASRAGVDLVHEPDWLPLGSGEGIAHAYAHRNKNSIEHDRHTAIFTAAEIDTLTALANRKGATIMSQLRSVYSGETLGFSYADATKRIILPPHTYRAAVIVGVQPEKAGPLIHDADGGTPQRFAWAAVTDPTITDNPPPEPTPLLVPAINWDQVYLPAFRGRRVLTIPDQAAATIRAARAARARGEGNALDGHALFTREKYAQAFAILDQRIEMNDEDWHLAGLFMAHSDVVRARLEHTLREAAKADDERRAHREARRQLVINETIEQATINRVCGVIERALQRANGPLTQAALRRQLDSKDRGYYEPALARLAELGKLKISVHADATFIERSGS